jgi:hypothetical protein
LPVTLILCSERIPACSGLRARPFVIRNHVDSFGSFALVILLSDGHKKAPRRCAKGLEGGMRKLEAIFHIQW